MKRIKENWKQYLIIIIVASIVCIPLLDKELDIARDDGIQHICRLIGTKQAIEQGTGAIMANFCNGFGYSWSIFYSPLTAYVPMIFALFTKSYVVMLKLFIYVVSIATGLTMYRFIRSVTENKNIAIIAAALYILAPYRLTDIYIRVAIAELTSFAFLPLVFLGIYRILNSEKYKETNNIIEEKRLIRNNVETKSKIRKSRKLLDYDFIIGTSCLILSHTVITLYTAIFCAIYLLAELIFRIMQEKRKIHNSEIETKADKDEKKAKRNKETKEKGTAVRKKYYNKILEKFIVNAITVIMITAFYTIPLLMHKYTTDYEVFKEGRMLRIDALMANKVHASNLFLDDSFMAYCLGTVTILGIIATPLAYRKIRQEDYKTLYKFSLVSGVISIIMSLDFFPFEKLPFILTMLQFSYRMLEFSTFFLSIVVAINIEKIIKKLNLVDVLIIIEILIISTIPFSNHLKYNKIDEETLIEGVRVTEKTGRVHAGCASFEYLPIKAFENRNYIETRENRVYVLKGSCTIKNEEKENTNLKFDIENVEEETILELPYIYYIGYKAYLIKQDEQKVLLKTEESDKGFVQITLPKLEKGKVNVVYKSCINLEYMLKYIGREK